MEVKIEFKNKLKVLNLILALIWSGLGASRMIFEDDFGWISYLNIGLGVVYLLLFYLQSRWNYILIKDNVIIKKFDLFSDQMALKDIKSIGKFAGDYILNASRNKMTINTQMLEDESLLKLNNVLKELDVEWK